MPAIQIKSVASFEDIFRGVEQLSMPELEDFVGRILALRAKRKASVLSTSETELLQKINEGLLPIAQQRYNDLSAKRRQETLTPFEHQELLDLIAQIEQFDAKRVNCLAELAQLRRVSVRALMKQLGIRRPAYV